MRCSCMYSVWTEHGKPNVVGLILPEKLKQEITLAPPPWNFLGRDLQFGMK